MRENDKVEIEGFGVKLGRHFDDHVFDILSIALSMLQTVFLVLLADRVAKLYPNMTGAAVTGVIITAIAIPIITGFRYFRSRRMSDIMKEHANTIAEKEVFESEIDGLRELIQNNAKKIIDGYLVSLHGRLVDLRQGGEEHDDKSIQDRLSIYTEDNAYFIIQGRYATDPDHDSLKPKSIKDEGVVSKIWKNGWVFDNKFPDPVKNQGGYSQSQKRYIEEPGTLTMKARLYAGIRIKDGQLRKPLAVLLIESTLPSRYNREALKEFLKKELHYLSSTMLALTDHLPQHTLEKGLMEVSDVEPA